jgi:hypothetical protein
MSSISLADLRALPHLSLSQIRAFSRVRAVSSFSTSSAPSLPFRAIALAFGTAWHETIAAHLLPQGKDQYLSREELQALFRDCLTEEVCKEGHRCSSTTPTRTSARASIWVY